ncbi:hypothetical protein [Staphylococcus microti]|uniref:hypothetical protein n=1 Tax=Staphylococcus microti TaxID=569857 RepID=UPI0024AFF18D|nr:hypothetical protein [Staphylococcus microti]
MKTCSAGVDDTALRTDWFTERKNEFFNFCKSDLMTEDIDVECDVEVSTDVMLFEVLETFDDCVLLSLAFWLSDVVFVSEAFASLLSDAFSLSEVDALVLSDVEACLLSEIDTDSDALLLSDSEVD